MGHKTAIVGTALFFGAFALVAVVIAFLHGVFGSWLLVPLLLLYVGAIYSAMYCSSETSMRDKQ